MTESRSLVPTDPPCDHRGERNRKWSTQCFTDWFARVDGDRAALAGAVGSQPEHSLHQRHNLRAFHQCPRDLCHDAQTDTPSGRPKPQHGALHHDILHTQKVLHFGVGGHHGDCVTETHQNACFSAITFDSDDGNPQISRRICMHTCNMRLRNLMTVRRVVAECVSAFVYDAPLPRGCEIDTYGQA